MPARDRIESQCPPFVLRQCVDNGLWTQHCDDLRPREIIVPIRGDARKGGANGILNGRLWTCHTAGAGGQTRLRLFSPVYWHDRLPDSSPELRQTELKVP